MKSSTQAHKHTLSYTPLPSQSQSHEHTPHHTAQRHTHIHTQTHTYKPTNRHTHIHPTHIHPTHTVPSFLTCAGTFGSKVPLDSRSITTFKKLLSTAKCNAVQPSCALQERKEKVREKN
jgi:hypothetical protein